MVPKGFLMHRLMHRRTLTTLWMTALIGLSGLCALLCASGAQAAQGPHVAGTIVAVTPDQFTIQTPGKPVGVLNALTSAANRITAEDLPYVWGGGHGEAGVPSIGERGGSGFNGRRKGYDCSGAVAAVLVAGGLWPQGSGVPNDEGVIQYLRRQGLIAPGAGTGPTEVTLYDNPGVHIFMNIDGRFWGTSDGGGGGDSKGGPGWLDDGAWDVTNRNFRRYHFLSSALKAKTTAGYSLTFYATSLSTMLPSTGVGSKVSVSYSTSKYGTMIAKALSYTNLASAAGVVTGIGVGYTSFTVEDANGTVQTFQVTPGTTVYQQLVSLQLTVNAVVQVNYVPVSSPPSSTGGTGLGQAGVTLVATSVTIDSPPPPTTTSTTPTTTTPTTTTPTTTTPSGGGGVGL